MFGDSIALFVAKRKMNMKSITVPGTSTDDVFIGKFCWKRVICPDHVPTSKSLKSEFKTADVDKITLSYSSVQRNSQQENKIRE